MTRRTDIITIVNFYIDCSMKIKLAQTLKKQTYPPWFTSTSACLHGWLANVTFFQNGLSKARGRPNMEAFEANSACGREWRPQLPIEASSSRGLILGLSTKKLAFSLIPCGWKWYRRRVHFGKKGLLGFAEKSSVETHHETSFFFGFFPFQGRTSRF